MTPRELAGWVPAERHEHYDAHDTLTGYTVVIRESRIDDADRTALLGLAMYEDQLSPCGFHPSIANDLGNGFVPEAAVCPVCAALAQWDRVLRAEDEKFAKDNPDAPPRVKRPSDGRTPYMRWLSPDEDDQFRKERTKPDMTEQPAGGDPR